MNILKVSNGIDKPLYQKVATACKFDEAWAKILRGANKYRLFNIELVAGGCYISTNETLESLTSISTLCQLLPKEEQALLLTTRQKQFFKLTQKTAILSYLHLDLLLAIAVIAKKPDNKEGLMEYLKQATLDEKLSAKLERIAIRPLTRSTIYTFNKNSILIDLRHKSSELNRNVEKLSPKQTTCLRACQGVSLVEIDADVDLHKLSQFIESLKAYLDIVCKIHPELIKHPFELKLRKIKRTLKKGMYIKATNSMLLDPRHTDSIRHELGHWVHTVLYPEMTSIADCEQFAENFDIWLNLSNENQAA